jgi:hypothetical protein
MPRTLHLINSDRLLLGSIELVPNISGQNVNAFVPLRRGNFVIISTKLRFYVREVLDIYKQATGSRYGSVDDANSASSSTQACLFLHFGYIFLRSAMPRALPYHDH